MKFSRLLPYIIWVFIRSENTTEQAGHNNPLKNVFLNYKFHLGRCSEIDKCSHLDLRILTFVFEKHEVRRDLPPPKTKNNYNVMTLEPVPGTVPEKYCRRRGEIKRGPLLKNSNRRVNS